MPMVSVLLPVYNAEKYLSEAIDSILNQTYANFEFIIINDGSIDNSEKIILSYNDRRIRYIRNEKNIRLVASLNKGIQLARGRYLVRMDADDISMPNRIEKQVTFMENNLKVGVCGSYLRVFGDERRVVISKLPIMDKDIRASLLVRNSLGHPNVIIRKSTLTVNGVCYDERFYRMEDWGLWITLMPKCKFANCPEVLLNYRWVNTSESRINTKDEKHLIISMKVVKLFFSQLAIDCSDYELEMITSIIKAPHVYNMTKKQLNDAIVILNKKLSDIEDKIPNVTITTFAHIARFSFRRRIMAYCMIKKLGLKMFINCLTYDILSR